MNEFKIKFGCGNCGRTFTKTFSAGTRVSNKTVGGVVFGEESVSGHIKKGESTPICCPTCESEEHVDVKERMGGV